MRTVALLALAAGLAATPQTPAPARTGLIVGQVIEAGSNRPVPEAIVTLMGSGSAIDPRDRWRRVIADQEGRYFFGELSAGTYSIRAIKAGYPQNFVGNSRALFTSLGSFDLAVGERRGGVNIMLWKFATLSGTVLDEAGEPMVGIEVRVLRRSFAAGIPRFVQFAASSGRTDDRGAFRITSLLPGHYIVCVASSHTTMPLAVFEQNLWQTSDERTSAIPEFQILGYSQNQRVGDAVLMTRSGVAWPPAPAESGRLIVYPTTYLPSTTTPTDATIFSLSPGEERSAGPIQLRPVPAVRVTGKLVGPRGPVALTALRLAPAGANPAEVVLDPVTGLSDPSGAFSLLAVPPGEYVLRVLTLPSSSTTADPVLWASLPLSVTDSDVSDLTVTLRPVLQVSGRLEFQGTSRVPPGAELRECCRVSVSPNSGAWGRVLASPDTAGIFTAAVPGGSYVVTAEPPPGWHLRAVMFEGRDISDMPMEMKADVAGIVVVFSDDPTQIAGTVRNAQGAADENGSVVVFPTDRRMWTGYSSLFNRRVLSRPIGARGEFRITALPPGDYFLAAIPDTRVEDWQDAKVLESLSRTATRVSLGEKDKKSVDLRMTGGR
jgi:hypothetical protein